MLEPHPEETDRSLADLPFSGASLGLMITVSPDKTAVTSVYISESYEDFYEPQLTFDELRRISICTRPTRST